MPTGKRGAHPEAVYKALDLCVDGWKGQGHAHNQKAPGPASLAQGMHSQWQASRGDTLCNPQCPLSQGTPHTRPLSIIKKGESHGQPQGPKGMCRCSCNPPGPVSRQKWPAQAAPHQGAGATPGQPQGRQGAAPQSQAPSTQCAAPISNCQANKGHRATSLQQHQASHTQPQK